MIESLDIWKNCFRFRFVGGIFYCHFIPFLYRFYGTWIFDYFCDIIGREPKRL